MHQLGTRIAAAILALNLAGFSTQSRAATVTKANNTDALDQGSSWVGGVAPGSGDTIVWDSTVTSANTVLQGGDLSVQGIRIENPGGLVRIDGDAAQTLTVGAGGIDLSTATQNLNLAASGELAVRLAMGANQIWNVPGGRSITSGNINTLGVLVANNGHTLTVDGGGGVFLGSYEGSGGLTVQGGSTLHLRDAGLFAYSGGLTLTGSTLVIRGIFSQAGERPLGSGSLTVHDATLNLIVGNSAYNHGNAVAMSGNLSINNSSISGGNPGRDQTFGTLAISGSGTLAVTATGTNDASIIFGATTLSGSPTFDVGSREGNGLRLGAIGESGGTRSITKAGIGTLQLVGASSYTGTTTISDGTLVLTGAGSLPAAGAVSNAGTLDISGITASGTTVGSLAGAGSVALGGKTLTLGDATSTAVDGVISGVGGSLVKQGSGALTLSGANTFDGTLTVAAGTLAIATITDAGVAGPLGAGSAAVVLGDSGSTGTLSYTGPTAASTRPFTAAGGGTAAFSITEAGTTLTLSGLIDGAGDKRFGGAGSYVIGGGFGGSGTVTKTGSGSLTLTQAGHAGGYEIEAGRLNLNAASAIGNATSLALGSGVELDNTSGAAVTINNGTVAIALGSSLDFVGTQDLNLGLGTVTLGSSAAIDVAAGTLTFGGNVVDGGGGFGLTKRGAGTLVLSGLTTGAFSGNSVIEAGELHLSGTSVLGGGAGSTLTLNPGGTLRIGGTASTGGVTIVDNGGMKIVETLQNSGQTFAVSTALSASDALFNGVQTIAAGVTVSASQDWLGSIPASPTAGRIVLENAAVLASTNAIDIDANKGITLAGASATFDTSAGSIFLRPVISGSGQLVKIGSNGFRLYNTGNDYTGGTVAREGTIGIYGDGSLGAVSGALLLDGGTVNSAQGTSGQTITIDTSRVVQLANGKTSGLAATNGSTLAYAGVLAEAAAGAAAGLRIGAATQGGTVLLGGANTYAGDTTIAGGTLKLGSGGSLANSPTIIVGDAGSTGAVFDISEKTAFAIAAGQTLSGKGTVVLGSGTNLTIAGLLSPGNSPGLLTYDGGGTVTLAGTTLMEFTGTARGVDPGYDAIDLLNGTDLTFGGTLNLDFSQTFADGTTFSLFTPDGTSSLTNTFSSITMVGSAYTDLTFTDNAGFWTTNVGGANQSMTFDSSTGELAILVVPEPATLVLVAAAAGLALLRRRLAPRLPGRLP